MDHNVTSKKFEDYDIKSIVSDTDILEMQKLNGFIYLDPKIKSYIMELIKKTRNKDFKMGDYIELGGSPRATIAVSMAAKSRAMINGRNYVTPADIKLVIKDVLRHRLILSYKARAEGVTADDVMDEILKVVPVP